MKKRFGNFVLLVLALSFLLSVSALAADTRASAQISDYYMDAYAYGGGQIAIEFSVACNGRMSRLGALEIAYMRRAGLPGCQSTPIPSTAREWQSAIRQNTATPFIMMEL